MCIEEMNKQIPEETNVGGKIFEKKKLKIISFSKTGVGVSGNIFEEKDSKLHLVKDGSNIRGRSCDLALFSIH